LPHILSGVTSCGKIVSDVAASELNISNVAEQTGGTFVPETGPNKTLPAIIIGQTSSAGGGGGGGGGAGSAGSSGYKQHQFTNKSGIPKTVHPNNTSKSSG